MVLNILKQTIFHTWILTQPCQAGKIVDMGITSYKTGPLKIASSYSHPILYNFQFESICVGICHKRMYVGVGFSWKFCSLNILFIAMDWPFNKNVYWNNAHSLLLSLKFATHLENNYKLRGISDWNQVWFCLGLDLEVISVARRNWNIGLEWIWLFWASFGRIQ